MHTIIEIVLTFDPAKNAKNIQKHGVALTDVVTFEWESALIWPDQRKIYLERRMIGLGYIGKRLFNVVFVDRDNNRRLISLRKANSREMKHYAQT